MGRLMAGVAVVAGVASHSLQRTAAALSAPVNVSVTASVAFNWVMTGKSRIFSEMRDDPVD